MILFNLERGTAILNKKGIFMRVFSIIFGILMTIFGICCMVTPLYTAFQLNIFIMILAVVYGIVGIISGIASKRFGLGFVFSILSVIFGILMLFFPNLIILTDAVILYMAAGWILAEGIVTIINSIRIGKVVESKMWIFSLIMGILDVLLGIYSFFHPLVLGFSLAWVIGILLGGYFVFTGISMIVFNPKSE